jgi:transcription initiation factor TFIIB
MARDMASSGAVRKAKVKGIDHCPECGGQNLIEDFDVGEIICGTCGLVVKERVIDEGPEWRAFTREEKDERSRVGTPLSYSIHDKGLSTVIDRVNRDAFGRELPISTRLQMLRLRKWQIRARVHSAIDRNLAQAMAELDRLSDKVHTPSSVKEKAALIYRKALDKGLVRGRSISAIAAASLYAACRFSKTPRTLKEIAVSSLVRRKDIARCYRLLLRELEIQMPIADPIACVPKIAAKLNVSIRVQSKAMEILKIAEKAKVVSGKDPMGLAAAAIYIACVLENERKTQKEIAEATGVTEVTVRNRYKGLRELLKLNV